ncbi:hypothetical protein AGMMS4956_20150 [Bacteroidia bacterium]|nr:hypothetical protein AGMMS4956_20150 [Bacteroidia bacterium]
MWKRLLKEYFTFSKSERRGIIILSILLLVAMGIPLAIKFFTPAATNNYQQLKLKVDSLAAVIPAANTTTKKTFERKDNEVQLFYFDPNTISADSLQLLGFSQKQAMSVVRYRERGGEFDQADDFLKLNIVSNHQHLKKYIRIAKVAHEVAVQKTTVSVAKPFSAPPVDINSADTALLKTLPGVGNYLAQRIVEYRQKLGGYTSTAQLCEIKFFDAEKLERLQSRLTLDTSAVQRFQLTTEEADRLRLHPYGGAYTARGVMQHIKYKGGKTTLQELVQNNDAPALTF